MSTTLAFDPIRLPPHCVELRKEVRAFLKQEIAAGTFDPNSTKTLTNEALFNRATLGVYEQGSTFKIFNLST